MEAITIEQTIRAKAQKVWDFWNAPEHVINWCHASDDWGVNGAENDLRVGGRFKTVMAAKDGSFSFDFGGIYTEVEPSRRLAYTMDDGRKVSVDFAEDGDSTMVTETFDPETENSPEMQKNGWQAILDNFKKYVESQG